MKCLLLALALFSSILIPSARAAALPYFETLRAQVLSQLDLATNGVEVPDKKLVSSLQKALTSIDKTQPDYASGAKALGKLAKALNRTSVSNVFAPVFESTVADYVGALMGEEDTLANRLAGTFPSKSKTAAESALIQLLNALDGANTNDDVVLAAKFLSTAAKNLSTAAKNVEKAEDAPAPPSQFNATINGAVLGNFNFTPSPAPAVAVRNVGIVAITGVNIKLTGSGLDTVVTTRTLVLNVPILDGTHVYGVAPSGGNVANVIYTVAQGSAGGPTSGDAYNATSGTVTVTMNTAARTAVGTFNFSAPAQGSSGTTASSDNGTFSVVWTE